MRLFIKHREDGEIVSVAKVEALPEGIEHPYVGLAENEAVLSVEPDADLKQLLAHEIGERYTVDTDTGSLRARGGDSPSRPPGRSRRRPSGA